MSRTFQQIDSDVAAVVGKMVKNRATLAGNLLVGVVAPQNAANFFANNLIPA